MKSISRVILLSTVGLLAYGQNNFAFASTNASPHILSSGFHTLYTHHAHIQPDTLLSSVGRPRSEAEAASPRLSAADWYGAGSPRGRKEAEAASPHPLAVGWHGAELALRAPRAGSEKAEAAFSSVSQSRAFFSLPLSNPQFPLSMSSSPLPLPLSRGSWRGYESSKESTSGYDKLAALVIPSLTLPISGRELDKSPISGRETEEFPVSEDEKIIKKNKIRVASVCFITDAGNCSGDKFSSNETPGGGSGNPGQNPEYNTPQEQCIAAGYGVTSCPTGSHGENPCPADSSYYKECVCDANMTETCEKPYYGVGPSCDGKYARCERDDDRACKEDGYTQTTACSSVQKPNGLCSYNENYHDRCICRDDLVSCTYPQSGVGDACDGRYDSCKCPDNFKSCDCGGAPGATSCTLNGKTTFSDCKQCCSDTCPDGYDNSSIPNGYVQDGETCNHCSLGLRYKIKPAPCDGYLKCPNGPETGASSCLSGNTTLYDKCKPCDNSCPSGTSEINPGGCGGSTTNECGTKTCYYPYKSCCQEIQTGEQHYGSCFCHPNATWYEQNGYSICCSISYTIEYYDGRSESGEELRNCGGDERDPNSCNDIIRGNCSYMEGRVYPVYETVCE